MAIPAGGVEGIGRAPVPVPDGTTSSDFSPKSLDQVVDLFVQLSEPSVAAVAAQGADSSAQKAQARKVSAQQNKLRRQVAQVGEITNSLRVGANGFRVEARLGDVPELYAIDGVISVAATTEFRPANETSVPWVGAEELAAMGFTGEGISIGIIDTGIDYLHANFGGSGSAAEYAANDTTTLADGGFPNAKVVGGYDFVGTLYNASCGDPGQPAPPACTAVPMPDEDPLDVNGHGSHVGGTAAGLGAGNIGAGVAPDADLYALKVFGDVDGSTLETSSAIEWALDPNGDGDTSDHLDVINMSLGSPFGNPNDPTALASSNAVALGMIVVASAGNEGGNTAYVTGSPGVADGAISVAASHDAGFGVGAIEVNSGPAELVGLHAAQEGAIGPALSVVGPVTGDLVVVDPLLGCDDLGEPVVPNNDLTGKIALIKRGVCSFGAKHETAVSGGAIALIVYNDEARGDDLLSMGFATSPIPSVFIGNTAGAALESAVSGGATVNVTLDADLEIARPELTDTIVDFSSRGPGGGGTHFKPDLSAPGVNIRSAGVGTGDASRILSGTSMAAPHVAGMTALLREKYPNLSVAAIKALLQNSTTPALSPEPLARQGVGVANVYAASQLEAYAMPGGVSFGRLNPFATDNAHETVTVTSMTGNKTYDISVEWNQEMPGVSLQVPSSFKVRDGQSKAFTAKLALDPAAMAEDDGFFSQSEVDGWILLDDGDEVLRVGFMAAIDPASAVRAQGVNSNFYQLVNHGKSLGLADGFSLVKEGDDAGLNVGAVGFRDAGGIMEFAVARTTPWETASRMEWDLFLDVDQDGVDDYIVVAVDLAFLLGGDPFGAVAVDVLDLSTFEFLGPFFFAFADYNDHVISLPVPDVFLEGNNAVDYFLVVFDGADVDGVQFGTIDVATQSAGVFTEVEAGERLRVPQIGTPILWLYPNNAVPDQYQIVN